LAHELTHVVQQSGSNSSMNISKKTNKETIQRYERLCMPASAWFSAAGVPAPWITSSAFGFLVETLINADYCSTVGCMPVVTDYFDDLSPTNYVNFLIAHNPHLAPDRTSLMILAATGLNRPDILTDRPGRKEFYEIKPKSVSGIEAGIAKLLTLSAFMSVYGLPYVYGTTYSPSSRNLFTITVPAGPWPIKVSITVSRIAPGLIVYEICVEGELALVTVAALALAIIAALLIFQPELSPILVPIAEALGLGAGAASPVLIPILTR